MSASAASTRPESAHLPSPAYPAPVWAGPAPEAPGPDRPRRRRAWVVLALVVLGVAVLVAEHGARGVVEGRVADGLDDAGFTGAVTVEVGGAPWRPSVLLAASTGRLDRVAVGVRDGAVAGLAVVRADYALVGLAVEVRWADRAVAVRDVDGGSVRLVLDPVAVGAVTGTDLRVVDGTVRYGPDLVPAVAVVRGSAVEVSAATPVEGLAPLVVPVADGYLLPCLPALEVTDDALVLACDGDRLPGVLAGPLGVPADLPEVGGPGAPAELPPPQTLVRPGG